MQVTDTAAGAPPVEIARWRSDELGGRPKDPESKQDVGGSGAPGTSASKHSLFAAAGLDGGSGNRGVRSPRAGCFVVCSTVALQHCSNVCCNDVHAEASPQ